MSHIVRTMVKLWSREVELLTCGFWTFPQVRGVSTRLAMGYCLSSTTEHGQHKITNTGTAPDRSQTTETPQGFGEIVP